MENPGVWKMELDRFGYTLVTVGRTKDEAEEAMRKEYIRAYAQFNDLNEDAYAQAIGRWMLCGDPNKAEDEDVELYRAAFEDNEPRFYEFGKVEWE